jgi:hypothetical protein
MPRRAARSAASLSDPPNRSSLVRYSTKGSPSSSQCTGMRTSPLRPLVRRAYMRSIQDARQSGAGNGFDQYPVSLAMSPSLISKMKTHW